MEKNEGFLFNITNAYGAHIRKMTARARKVINVLWEIWKRAGIGLLEDRLLLLNAIGKVRCMYEKEIWRWINCKDL